MSKLINQKFIEGIDSSKFKIAANGALMAVDGSGNMVELLKLNPSGAALLLGVEVASKSALESLVSDLTFHIASNEASFSEMDGRLDSIESEMPNKASVSYVNEKDEATLAASKLYADQRVSDLVNGAPEILDTLKEISDALGGDANLAGTLTGQISSVQSGLASEISRATAAEAQALSDAKSYADTKDALKVSKSGDTMSGKLTSLPSSGDTAFETYKQSAPRAFGLVAREQAIAGIYNQFYVVSDPAPSTNGTINLTTAGNVYLNNTVSDANFKGSVWRIDNGRNEAVAVTINSYNNPAFSLSFVAPAYSRVFVISPVRVTHTMTTSYGAVTKSANTNIFGWDGLYGSAEMLSKTDIQSGKIKLTGSAGAPSLPVSGEDVAVKKYVDDQDTLKLSEAKAYADVKVADEASARSSADAANLAQAKAYADQKKAEEAADRASADNALDARIDSLESGIGNKVSKSGDSMSGKLTLNAGLEVTGRTQISDIVDGPTFIFEPALASFEVVNNTVLPGMVSVIQPGQMVVSQMNEAGDASMAQTNIEPGILSIYGEGTNPAMASEPHHATTKKYVDDAISAESSARSDADSALDGRVAALEAKPGLNLKNKYGVLGAGDLMHIDLDHQALEGGIIALYVDRTIVYPGMDFTISVVEGKTRITWAGELANPDGSYAVVEGDDFYCVYAI